MKSPEHFPEFPVPCLFFRPLCAKEDILPDVHMGEEGEVLEYVSKQTFLRGEIGPCASVEEDLFPETYEAFVGLHKTRDHLEGHGLSSSRAPEEDHQFITGLPCNIKRETLDLLFKSDRKSHHSILLPNLFAL